MRLPRRILSRSKSTRILLRTGKDPFEPLPAESTLARGVLGRNAGNLLYAQAVHHALSVPASEIVCDPDLAGGREPTARLAGRVNDNFDILVVPLANAFRRSFLPNLDRLTRLIEQLSIPVVIVGVGAQANPTATAFPDFLRDPVRRFMTAVLDHSESVGVRGEITRRLLLELGFDDRSVEVVGCPSLFGPGHDAPIALADAGLTAHSRLSVNLTLSQPRSAHIATRAATHYPNLEYVAQSALELRLMIKGEPLLGHADPETPSTLDHPLYREGRVRFFLDPVVWRRHLATRDFVFGTRIHGNIAALTAGTPVHLLAFDSRTIEIADYHAIPRTLLSQVSDDTDPAKLYEAADPAAYVARRPAALATYLAFLERNGLDHTHRRGLDPKAWERRLDGVDFPAAVTVR